MEALSLCTRMPRLAKKLGGNPVYRRLIYFVLHNLPGAPLLLNARAAFLAARAFHQHSYFKNEMLCSRYPDQPPNLVRNREISGK